MRIVEELMEIWPNEVCDTDIWNSWMNWSAWDIGISSITLKNRFVSSLSY